MEVLAQILGAVKYIVKKADMVLLGICLTATAFGIVLIASATNYLGTDVQTRRLVIQAAATVIGIVAYFIASNVDVEQYAEKWWLFLAFNLGFIALLIVFGEDDGTGNKSWIAIPGLTSIQPAEIVKLTFTVLLAKQMAWFRDNRGMRGLGSLVWPAAHMGLMVVWIFAISGDAGSALVYLMIFAGMACAAGLAWYWFAAGFTGLGVGIAALILLDKMPAYMANRFRVIFDHSFDPQGVGWQQTRSLMAIGSGGVFGQGLFQGIQTQSALSENLPERHTDLIFAVCGEELGLVGCLVIILIEFLVVWRSDLRGLRLHADLPDGGEHRHVPVRHAGHRPDPAFLQLRRQLHRHPLHRHGHCLRRPEPDIAGLAAEDVIKSKSNSVKREPSGSRFRFAYCRGGGAVTPGRGPSPSPPLLAGRAALPRRRRVSSGFSP